jgi:TRAP-type mannitol/chloroaromatic compound transport system permease small subunit
MHFSHNREVSSMLEKVSSAIDAFSSKSGQWASLLILPLTFIVIYEVIMRYVFDAPTIWGFEATTFLYGIHFMLGLAYTDVTNGHVKVDIFSARAQKRTQAVLVILANLIIFLPVFSCMTIWAWKYAITSVMQRELNSTSWAPAIWPIKLVMAFAFSMLLIQGISTIIKSFTSFSISKKS